MTTIDIIAGRIDAAGKNGFTLGETCSTLHTIASLAFDANERVLSAWLHDIADGEEFRTHRTVNRQTLDRVLAKLADQMHPDTDGPALCRLAARVLAPWGR